MAGTPARHNARRRPGLRCGMVELRCRQRGAASRWADTADDQEPSIRKERGCVEGARLQHAAGGYPRAGPLNPVTEDGERGGGQHGSHLCFLGLKARSAEAGIHFKPVGGGVPGSRGGHCLVGADLATIARPVTPELRSMTADREGVTIRVVQRPARKALSPPGNNNPAFREIHLREETAANRERWASRTSPTGSDARVLKDRRTQVRHESTEARLYVEGLRAPRSRVGKRDSAVVVALEAGRTSRSRACWGGAGGHQHSQEHANDESVPHRTDGIHNVPGRRWLQH